MNWPVDVSQKLIKSFEDMAESLELLFLNLGISDAVLTKMNSLLDRFELEIIRKENIMEKNHEEENICSTCINAPDDCYAEDNNICEIYEQDPWTPELDVLVKNNNMTSFAKIVNNIHGLWFLEDIHTGETTTWSEKNLVSEYYPASEEEIPPVEETEILPEETEQEVIPELETLNEVVEACKEQNVLPVPERLDQPLTEAAEICEEPVNEDIDEWGQKLGSDVCKTDKTELRNRLDKIINKLKIYGRYSDPGTTVTLGAVIELAECVKELEKRI